MADEQNKPVAVVVYGPAACGKTTHKDTLREFFGCSAVVDDWRPEDPLMPYALHLLEGDEVTVEQCDFSDRVRVLVVSFEEWRSW